MSIQWVQRPHVVGVGFVDDEALGGEEVAGRGLVGRELAGRGPDSDVPAKAQEREVGEVVCRVAGEESKEGGRESRMSMKWEEGVVRTSVLVGSSLDLLSRFGPHRIERRNEIHGSL